MLPPLTKRCSIRKISKLKMPSKSVIRKNLKGNQGYGIDKLSDKFKKSFNFNSKLW